MDTATLERKLSNHEQGFQDLDTPTRLQVVSGVVFLSDSVDSQVIWNRVQDFFAANSQFRCRIVGGRSLKWRVDDSFDPSNHCDEIALGDVTKEDVLSFVANGASSGLPADQPPWRIALLRLTGESNEPERCAIAIWAHHSLLDGLQGMKLYASLMDGTRRLSNAATPSADDQAAHPEDGTPVMSASCVRSVAGEMLRRPTSGPFTSKAPSSQRTTLAFEWSRKSFQTARRERNASFQEILLTVLANVLARYANQNGHTRNLRALLPLGRSEDKSSAFTTNRHDVGFIDLPAGSATANRFVEIRQSLQSLRQEQENGVFGSILGFMGWLPNAMRQAVAHRFARQADLLISLIPGGPSKNTIGGADVTALFAQPALPPKHSVVVGVTVSRRDVCVTVQVDPASVDRPQQLKVCFEQAFSQVVLDRSTLETTNGPQPAQAYSMLSNEPAVI